MTTLHPDSQAIDRLGVLAVRLHFGMTRHAVYYWRRKGVPVEHRRALIALGRRLGDEMAEIKIKHDRKRGRPTTSGKSPTSPATPA